MTESEWLTAISPFPMFDFLLSGETSERKLRLYVCAWFGGTDRWDGVTDIIAIGERYADGVASPEEVEQARSRAIRASGNQAVWVTVCENIENRFGPVLTHEFADFTSHLGKYVHWLHDIFGNPFRPITIDPRWQTETVVALATGIYTERAFDRMPILADALEEVGCDHADILAHCRGDGAHVRGCWVVDLLLGKS